MKSRFGLPGQMTPYVILVGALLLTALATVLARAATTRDDLARFENRVQAAIDRVATRMEIYVALLRSGAAQFTAHEISRSEWRHYTDRLELPQRYPGIMGIGYTRRIPAESLAALIRAERRAGSDEFRVWPDSAREEYHAILYLQPMNRRNAAAIGYDMYTNPVRREAMARARDEGTAAMSGAVTLVQEIEGEVQPGFLIYVPVYDHPSIPPTVEERRRLLRGFVYAPFRAGDLFLGIFGTERNPRLTFAVYDGSVPRPEALLFDSDPKRERQHEGSALERTQTLEIAGRTWTLTFYPSRAFDSQRIGAPMIAAAGIAISLVLFVLAVSQSRARAAASEANRAKSQFLANMSHELRTPLNAIGGYVDLIDMELRGPVTPDQRADLARIKLAQRRLLSLINDVLDIAKLEAGRVVLRPAPVSVAGAVEEAEALILPAASERGVEYRRAGGEPLFAHADADKLQQILMNLLSNAVKFTPPGGRIEVWWKTEHDCVVVHVRDTGSGIAPELIERIFKPFEQGDADLTRANEGSGLGLAISRELARAMNGDITVKSTPGSGSDFTLRLRLAAPPE